MPGENRFVRFGSRLPVQALSFQMFNTSDLEAGVRDGMALTAAMSSNSSMGCRTGHGPVSILGLLSAAEAPPPPRMSSMSFSATCDRVCVREKTQRVVKASTLVR